MELVGMSKLPAKGDADGAMEFAFDQNVILWKVNRTRPIREDNVRYLELFEVEPTEDRLDELARRFAEFEEEYEAGA